MEVGGEGNYIPIATLSPPKSSALRWAAMRAIRCFIIVRDKRSQDSVHRPQLLKRKESRSGFNRDPSAYQPDALPLGQTGSPRGIWVSSWALSMGNRKWGGGGGGGGRHPAVFISVPACVLTSDTLKSWKYNCKCCHFEPSSHIYQWRH